MSNYFYLCTDTDQCKATYRKLFMQYSKDAAMMQQINEQLKDTMQWLSQPAPEAAAPEAAAPSQKIQDAANFAKTLPGLTVEITGQWVWVSGTKREDTELHSQLSQYGFKFSGKKCAWYFQTGKRFWSKNKLTLQQIRAKYGSEEEAENN